MRCAKQCERSHFHTITVPTPRAECNLRFEWHFYLSKRNSKLSIALLIRFKCAKIFLYWFFVFSLPSRHGSFVSGRSGRGLPARRQIEERLLWNPKTLARRKWWNWIVFVCTSARECLNREILRKLRFFQRKSVLVGIKNACLSSVGMQRQRNEHVNGAKWHKTMQSSVREQL